MYYNGAISYYKIMKFISKSALPAFILFFGVVFAGFTQEIVTADRYLETVSERYGGVRDYEAQVVIRSGSSDMTGNLSYRDPYFLRIDFTRPNGQILVFNGEVLSIYIPELRAILNQAVAPGRRISTVGASMASAQGLQLLRRGYVPAFLSGPAPVPLDERSQEMVVKLRLTRRLSSEGFREIILSVNPESRLIRRIEGRTLADALVRIDFANIRTNVGVPEQRFIFDAPASANMYNNFLFRDTD